MSGTNLKLNSTYVERRQQLTEYFGDTASKTWERLTSDAPVSGVRATVRAGRDRMRATLLSYLPDDLTGCRVLDAGCGTGPLAEALANRGADVVAIDLSASLVDVARQRCHPARGSIEFRVGDMSAPELGTFDHCVAMDSVIHYRSEDIAAVLGRLTAMTRSSLCFTFAPRTPLLSVMWSAGKLFPKSDRSPKIEPVRERTLRRVTDQQLTGWRFDRTDRIKSGFYTSQAVQLCRKVSP